MSDNSVTEVVSPQIDPQVSVVLINRNGAKSLPGALASLRHSLNCVRAKRESFQVVFVDNGSTDDSIQIARNYLGGLGSNWCLVREAEPGVNAARNSGLRAAIGKHIIFVDNDLEFTTTWLEGFTNAFKMHPEHRVFAGRVLVGPIEGEVPDWLDLTGPWSRPSIVVRCDNGTKLQEAELSGGNIAGPVGPNMAFERSIFRDYGVFDTGFGLRPGSLVAGAEAEFFHRLAKAKQRFVYVPEACARHPLKRNQMSKRYFRQRLSGTGRVLARLQSLDGIDAPRILGIKRYLLRQLANAWLAYVRNFLKHRPQQRFFMRCQISIVWGQICEDRMRSPRAKGSLDHVKSPDNTTSIQK